tara:strand:- start:61 stop:321 length:261 start_codon:yes stop_codon:yes gene_type:complete
MFAHQSTCNSVTPTQLIAPDDKNRWIYIHNSQGNIVYIGSPVVTASTGFKLDGGEKIEIFLPIHEDLYGITASSTSEVFIITPDLD